MRRPRPIEREPAPRWLLAASLLGSLLLHLGFALLPGVLWQPPAVDIEFTLPMDVELGMPEGLDTPAPVAEATPSPTAPPTRSAATDQGAADAGLADAAADAGPVDASLTDAAVRDGAFGESFDDGGAGDAAARRHPRDAGVPEDGAAADAGPLPPRLPPGTQIALRVDMARIRRSPIAADVRTLLAAIPDWQALLDGSGIDPVAQLDRLLIATPNLQRDKVVLAGRYAGGEQVVLEAVERLGRTRGQAVAWHRQGGVRVAPWANADATPRVIALVGPAHFTISRAEDLPRVLAIAAARAQKGKGRGRSRDGAVPSGIAAQSDRAVAGPQTGGADEASRTASPDPNTTPADALLSMEDDEGVSLEVEGVSAFVRRGRRGIPERLRLAALERPGPRIELRAVFTYPDAARASDARAYWDELRQAYARNPLVALLGLSGPLEDVSLEQHDQELRIRGHLSVEQARFILSYVRELVRPPTPPPP